MSQVEMTQAQAEAANAEFLRCDAILRQGEKIADDAGVQPIFFLVTMLAHARTLSASISVSLQAEGRSDATTDAIFDCALTDAMNHVEVSTMIAMIGGSPESLLEVTP
jgi:hypothetical protein